MKDANSVLRSLIKEIILEIAPGWSSAPIAPFMRKDTELERSDREAIGKLTHGEPDEDAVAPHLREPELTPEECWGPVPPTAPGPGAYADPWASDYGPLPRPHVGR